MLGSGSVGLVLNIMRFSVHDGPGIRTTVFLKGCPLDCAWCHNPESQGFRPTLLYFEERCRLCGDCRAACPNGAIAVEGRIRTLREVCRGCGMCVEACAAGAREIAGRRMTLAEVLAEVGKDTVFFDESGGGVTLSGGEPLAQPRFSEALLAACRGRGIHTVLDTCGFAARETLLRVAAQADLVLYDLKMLDSARHAAQTGVSNIQILGNLEALMETGCDVVARFPLIPTVNDDPAEVAGLAAWLARAGLKRLDVLPYHRIGRDKYRRLGASYKLEGLWEPSAAEVEAIAGRFRREGLAVKVGG